MSARFIRSEGLMDKRWAFSVQLHMAGVGAMSNSEEDGSVLVF